MDIQLTTIYYQQPNFAGFSDPSGRLWHSLRRRKDSNATSSDEKERRISEPIRPALERKRSGSSQGSKKSNCSSQGSVIRKRSVTSQSSSGKRSVGSASYSQASDKIENVYEEDESLPPIQKDRSIRLRVMPEQSNDYRVVVFGAGGVGKSSLVLRFVRGTFRESYIPTIEDTYRQVISCNKQVCTLQITDTTGSHQFPAMQRLSISKGHAFILVYSVSSRQSLEELRPIYQEIVEIKGDVEHIPVMLVGNKCDEQFREVQEREGKEIAKQWECAFLETSAKTNFNVKELFQELLQLEKRRTMSLQLDTKKSKSQRRKDKLKGKCVVM